MASRPGPPAGEANRKGHSAVAAIWAVAAVLWIDRVGEAWNARNLFYDLKPVRAAGLALAQGKPVYGVAAFVYPPSAALLVGRPLSLLAISSQKQAAAVVVALLAAGSAILGMRAMGRPWVGTSAATAVLATGLIGWLPFEMVLENLSVLVAFLAAGALLAWSRGRETLGGAVVGLSLAIKPLLAIILVCLLLLRRWRALAAALVVPLALNGLALAVDPSALHGLTSNISGVLSGHGPSFDPHNGALAAIGRTLGMPGPLTTSLRLLVAAAAIGATWLIWRRRPDPARVAEAAAVLIAGLFVDSTLFENHFVFVLVPFACAVVAERSPFRWWVVVPFAVLAGGLVVIGAGGTGLSADDVMSAQRGLALSACVLAVAVAAALLPRAEVRAPGRGPLHRSRSKGRRPQASPAAADGPAPPAETGSEGRGPGGPPVRQAPPRRGAQRSGGAAGGASSAAAGAPAALPAGGQ